MSNSNITSIEGNDRRGEAPPRTPFLALIDLRVERNLFNKEARSPLEMLCARVLVRNVFDRMDLASRNAVYYRIPIAYGYLHAHGNVDVGKNNVRRVWSKFVLAVNEASVPLGSRTIEHYELDQHPSTKRMAQHIRDTFKY